MTLVHRVLSPKPVLTLEDYTRRFGGGGGLRKAHSQSAEDVIEVVAEAGLRGRGGAGFPTGRKWRTVRENASASRSTTVVVNAAEGEPGTFKDRTILRCNPYQVIEGALIAARVLDSSTIIIALKRSFTADVARVSAAVAEVREAGWADGVDLVVFEGPDEYLYGEETALLETLEGRLPFSRIAPPFRRGMSGLAQPGEDGDDATGLSAQVQMAGADDVSQASPALIDNVETLANIPKILDRGAAWFRTEGTDDSPGTIVCTITGHVRRPGVGEVLMGTTLREAIEEIGGGARVGAAITAVMPGVSNAIVPAHLLDTPLTYEAMASIGSGLGSAGFWVLDDSVDPVAAVAGVVDHIEDLGHTGIEAARRLMGAMAPVELDGRTLRSALVLLTVPEPRSGSPVTDIRFDGDDERLPVEIEGALLRIAQEALTNARRHAEAHRVVVTLTCQPSTVSLDIVDDGVGFDADAVAGRGFGLSSMRGRAQQLGGTLHVDAEPGRGSTINATIPLPHGSGTQ